MLTEGVEKNDGEEEEKEKNSDQVQAIEQEALENEILNDKEEQGEIQIEKKEQEQTQKKTFEVQKPGPKQKSIKQFFLAKSGDSKGNANVHEIEKKLVCCPHCGFGASTPNALATHKLYCKQNRSRLQSYRADEPTKIKENFFGNSSQSANKSPKTAKELPKEVDSSETSKKEPEMYVYFVQIIN